MPQPDMERGDPRTEVASEVSATAKQLDLIESTSSSDAKPGIQPDPAATPRDGQRLRDRGLRIAETNIHPGAKLDAERVLQELIDEGAPFTAETFRDRLGGRVLASGPNSFGALIGAASRRGAIECVGYETATRPEAHGRLIRRWRKVAR